MAKYRLTGPFFDGIQMHQQGEVIDHDGKPCKVMVPVKEEPVAEAGPELEDLTVHQLREIAKAEGVAGGVTTLNKAELVAEIISLRHEKDAASSSDS